MDLETYVNLLNGLFTCYWCGGLADKDHIAAHVDNCLKEIHWLNKHVAESSDGLRTD